MGKVKMLALIITVLCIAGCGYVPSMDHQIRDKHIPIDEDVFATWEPGSTKRSDILLKIGTPSESFNENQYFIYVWQYLHGHFFMFGAGTGQGAVGGGGDALEVKTGHYLGIEFNSDNTLKRMKHIKSSETFAGPHHGDPYRELRKWLGSDLVLD